MKSHVHPAASALSSNDEIIWNKNPVGQSQSTLFRLPAELRVHVYQYVLGGMTIHFKQSWQGKLVHCVCPFHGRKAHMVNLMWNYPRYYCKSVSLPDGVGKESAREEGEERPERNRVPLLATCQQIYSEAIDILPSHNTINIQALAPHHFEILADIQTRLSLRPFHGIQSLEISYGLFDSPHGLQHPPNECWFEQWNEMCEVLASMKGLLDLHVWAKIEPWTEREVTPEQETQFFSPLLCLDHLRYFQVEVSWPTTTASAGLLRNTPFVLVRMKKAESPWLTPENGPICQVATITAEEVAAFHVFQDQLDEIFEQASRKREWRRRFASLIPFRKRVTSL